MAYPKKLYKNLEPGEDNRLRVYDAEDEAAAKKEGWKSVHEFLGEGVPSGETKEPEKKDENVRDVSPHAFESFSGRKAIHKGKKTKAYVEWIANVPPPKENR